MIACQQGSKDLELIFKITNFNPLIFPSEYAINNHLLSLISKL